MISNFLSKQSKTYSQLVRSMHLKELYQAIRAFDWQEYYAETKDKLKHLPRTNYELALYHLNIGNVSDAILRFKIAHFLDKDGIYADTDYYIGLCYYEKFKYDKAKEHLISYMNQKKPLYTEETDFLLKVINNRLSEITRVPSAIVAHRFDQMIATYGAESISNTSIPMQQQMLRQVNSYIQLHSKPFGNNILDIGCGTGSIGILARELKLASFIVGIDASQLMLKATQAATIDGVKVYNSTINANIEDYIIKKPDEHRFDIILADDSLGSTIQIKEMLSGLESILSPKGVIAISFHITKQKSTEFNPYIQQFMFNPKHIEKAAAAAKLKIYSQEDVAFSNDDAGAIMLFIKE